MKSIASLLVMILTSSLGLATFLIGDAAAVNGRCSDATASLDNAVAVGCAVPAEQAISLAANSDGHTYRVKPDCVGIRQIPGGNADNPEMPCPTEECQSSAGPSIWYELLRDEIVIGRTCMTDAQAALVGAITPAMVLREMKKLKWEKPRLVITPDVPNQTIVIRRPLILSTDVSRLFELPRDALGVHAAVRAAL